ncbi:hypothetical protein BGX30_002924 [Mortierella sp. GBA39]|nr:hypothetical protein BGX30_002924 [Mortierella sp. GBA39]
MVHWDNSTVPYDLDQNSHDHEHDHRTTFTKSPKQQPKQQQQSQQQQSQQQQQLAQRHQQNTHAMMIAPQPVLAEKKPCECEFCLTNTDDSNSDKVENMSDMSRYYQERNERYRKAMEPLCRELSKLQKKSMVSLMECYGSGNRILVSRRSMAEITRKLEITMSCKPVPARRQTSHLTRGDRC